MDVVKSYLYSTLGCHLCEQAKAVLWPVLTKYQCGLQEVDISSSDELIEKYGTRIPVLVIGEDLLELNWPFTTEQADAFFLSTLSRPSV